MSHEVKFNKPTDAMRYSMHYNGRGVRNALKAARISAGLGQNWGWEAFCFAFAFAAIQGYPVKCFYDCMVKKGLAR